MTLRNTSGHSSLLLWDRYSHAELAGHFDLQVEDAGRKSVLMTAYAEHLHTPDVMPKGGRPVSGGVLKFEPDQEYVIKLNVQKFAQVAVPGTYSLVVTLRPEGGGSWRSNRINLTIKDPNPEPALSMYPNTGVAARMRYSEN